MILKAQLITKENSKEFATYGRR